MFAQFKMMILSLFMAGNTSMAQPVSINMDNLDNLNQVTCLSQAVQGEAGNQSFEGKVAVAHVILNRTKNEKFPDTPCGVIKQKGQFKFKPKSLHPDKSPALRAQMEESIRAALAAFNGVVPDITKGSLYFVNAKTATDTEWLRKFRKMVRIDDHSFYGNPKVTVHPTRIALSSDR